MKEYKYTIADESNGFGYHLYSKEELTDDEFMDIVIRTYGKLLDETKPKSYDLRQHLLNTDDRFYFENDITHLNMKPTRKIIAIDEHDIILFINIKDEKSIVLGSGR